MDVLEQPKSLVEQAYEVILGAVCDGTLKPGERLTQEDIAARLNVSRQPVTHALAVLKSQGFLEKTGRRGVVVAPIDPKMFIAIYQFRSAVEPLAVQLATANITKQSMALGRELVERGMERAAAGDGPASLRADIDFHSFIYELSGNPLIGDSMRLNWHHLRRGMGKVLRTPGALETVWAEHAKILETMSAGEAEKAAGLMRQHLSGALDRASQNKEV